MNQFTCPYDPWPFAYANEEASRDASHYAIVDCEVGMKDKRVHDIGAFTVIFALSFCH